MEKPLKRIDQFFDEVQFQRTRQDCAGKAMLKTVAAMAVFIIVSMIPSIFPSLSPMQWPIIGNSVAETMDQELLFPLVFMSMMLWMFVIALGFNNDRRNCLDLALQERDRKYQAYLRKLLNAQLMNSKNHCHLDWLSLDYVMAEIESRPAPEPEPTPTHHEAKKKTWGLSFPRLVKLF